MMDFLGVTAHRQQGKGGFDQHSVIPCSLFTTLHVIRYASSAAEAPISQQDSLLVIFLKKIQKGLIRTVHFVPNPATSLPETVENPAQFHADTLASFIAALGSKLPLGASLADRENQLYRIAIDHIQHAGLLQ